MESRIETMVAIWERINNKSIDRLLEEKLNKERVLVDSFDFNLDSLCENASFDSFNGIDFDTAESFLNLGKVASISTF